MAERIDKIHIKGYSIIQDKTAFCYGIDAVLLADFALKMNQNKTEQTFVDLGSGNGIIPILLCAQKKELSGSGLEIQPGMADMARRSVELNLLNDRIKIVEGDIKKIKEYFEPECADFVTSNPPYMIPSRGRQSENLAKMIARQELLCNLSDVVKAASFLLKKSGIFCMIHRAERKNEIFDCLLKNGFTQILWKEVKPDEKREANLILVCANLKEAEGEGEKIKKLKDLIIYGSDGSYTDEVKKIYSGELN